LREVDCDALIERFRTLGGNLFDTAEFFGEGQSERALGRHFRKHGGRENAIFVTRGSAEPQWVRPEYVRTAIERSLERLQTNVIELYLLQRDDPQVSVTELIDVLAEATRAGKVRTFGAANWSLPRLTLANDYARSKGLPGFIAASAHLGLAVPREPWAKGATHATKADLAAYANAGLSVLAGATQCRGYFAKRPISDLAYMADLVRVYYTADNQARRERLMRLADALQVDPAALAVAYVLALPYNLVALVGALSPEDLTRVSVAASLRLDQSQVWFLETGKKAG
jgi:aryl-alcohol dehydrogenase-like predicted oxidoreductase